jgi:hypothetical protein
MALKCWEIIANRLKKAGWSLGYVSAVDLKSPRVLVRFDYVANVIVNGNHSAM